MRRNLRRVQQHCARAKLETEIERMIAEELGEPEGLAEFGPLGARLVIQRPVDDEVTAFLGRARSPIKRGVLPPPGKKLDESCQSAL